MLEASKEKRNLLRGAMSDARGVRQGLDLMASLKHVPNFFPTPRNLVNRMIEEAALSPGMTVLEPSAGKGNIAKAVTAAGCSVDCIEQNHTLADHLTSQGFKVQCCDFLEVPPLPIYDCVLMNPPFERGIDRDHIRHAFAFLKPVGKLVAIACSTTGDKLQGWVDDLDGIVEPLPAGSFAASERPTQVNTCLILIHK